MSYISVLTVRVQFSNVDARKFRVKATNLPEVASLTYTNVYCNGF